MTADRGFICECGGEFKLDKSFNLYDPLTPYYSENLARTPILIESRSHRQALMKAHKVDIKPYKKQENEGYRPWINGHRMTEHQYQMAQRKGFVHP